MFRIEDFYRKRCKLHHAGPMSMAVRRDGSGRQGGQSPLDEVQRAGQVPDSSGTGLAAKRNDYD